MSAPAARAESNPGCCGVDALSRHGNGGGPTQTQTAQARFGQRLRGAFGRINAVIREWVRSKDLFGLRGEALVDEPAPEPFRFRTDSGKVFAFIRWLREQLESEVLSTVSGTQNQYVRTAYAAGIRHARRQLADGGVDVSQRDLESVFNLPVHRTTLQHLFTRTFENLRGITDDVATAIREELTQGFAAGENPTKIARRLTDRVNAIGKHRATLLARTEIINAHSEATLNRFEEAGVDTVRHGEWATAGDSRVCPICKSLDGREFTIEEMRSGTFRYEADEDEPASLTGEYRLKPPAHPQGRCTILPVIT